MGKEVFTILFVNHAGEDIDLINQVFEEQGIDSQLLTLENGEDFLDYLKRRGDYKDQGKFPVPNLVLFEINENFSGMREPVNPLFLDPEIKGIPIVVLINSTVEADFQEIYGMGITGYIGKPVTFNGLVDLMKLVGKYWYQPLSIRLG
jgi:CheY-like chemotaxis protein